MGKPPDPKGPQGAIVSTGRNNNIVPGSGTAIARTSTPGARLDHYRTSAAAGPVAAPRSDGKILRVLLGGDATGSMDVEVQETAKDSEAIAADAIERAGQGLEIGAAFYRDIDVGDRDVFVASPIVRDASLIKPFLDGINSMGGGSDGGERLELMLWYALKERFNLVCIFADDFGHTAESKPRMKYGGVEIPYATDLIPRLNEQKVKVHIFVVRPYDALRAYFKRITDATGGITSDLRVEGEEPSVLRHRIVMMILAEMGGAKGKAAVQQYVNDHRHQLGAGSQDLAQRLMLSAGK